MRTAFGAPDGDDDDLNPEFPDPMPTESQVMVSVARAEYDALDAEEQAKVDEAWAKLPWWRREDIRAEAELDLL